MIYSTLLKAVKNNTITRKTACRVLIKYGMKTEYIAMLLSCSLSLINAIISIDDGFIDNYDGTEITSITD